MTKKDSAVAEDPRFQFDDPQVRHNGLVLESEVDGAGPVKFAARARRPSFVRPGRGLRRIDLQYWITAGVTLFAVALMPVHRTARRPRRHVQGRRDRARRVRDRHLPRVPADGHRQPRAGRSRLRRDHGEHALLQVASFTLTPRLFPDEVRYTGTALATNISVVIAGGTAPAVGVSVHQAHRA
ncbi:hypothetical protein [Amycolatopsis thermoflava]|uniref:hypothetical protein n=1 Tax=Amycolatopsis thermoflava TaxID=84480 RepID=UPI0011CD59F9|nr:hypothetical protein [Amycolatopsis thermoflava]